MHLSASTICLGKQSFAVGWKGQKWPRPQMQSHSIAGFLEPIQVRISNLYLYLLRIQLKLNTALLSTLRLCVRAFVTGVTPHISHIYKGINAMLIIRGPIKPYIFWIKIILAIFLAKTRPDKTNFSALTNLTIDFDAESALFTLSCFFHRSPLRHSKCQPERKLLHLELFWWNVLTLTTLRGQQLINTSCMKVLKVSR